MRQNNTGSKAAKNSTRTATVKGTFMYRCHLSAKHQTYSSYQVEFTDIITATCDDHALGILLTVFTKKYPQYDVRMSSITIAQLIISNR